MLFLMIPYLAAIALIAIELGGGLPRRAPRTPQLPAWLWIAALIVTYGIQLALVKYGATSLLTPLAWRLAMPLPVMFIDARNIDAISAGFLACAAMQSYALLALYRANPRRALIVAGTATLVAMSLLSPALASFDPYGYIHNALLGFSSWTPPATPFPGDYHVIDLWFKKPTATLYGPLWIPIVQLITIAAPNLLTKLLALRAAGALLFVALLVLLRALGLPRRIVVVTALNPALAFYFIANAHNDAIAIDLIVAAALFARRMPILTFALIALAGLVKLPYAALGLPVLAAVRPVALRYAGAAAMIAATLLGSWFGGGAGYVHALTAHGLASHEQNLWHLVPVAIALVALVVAFAGGRRLIGALWIIPSIGAFGSPILFPWYLTWGFPYALARRRIAGFLLVALPFASAVIAPELMRVWTLFLVFPFAVVLSARGWFRSA